jgi:uncharacterized RDD family membrane protein YckC
MEVLDGAPVSISHNEVVYGGFWVRFGAMIVDGLVLAPLTVSVSYFNVISWKSSGALIVLTLLSVMYKPFCEFYYGATLGKMALRLKVVNLQFEKANLEEVLLRNIFHIVPSLIVLAFSIVLYNEPEFQEIDGYMEYATFSQQFSYLNIVTYLSAIITLVDGIMLIADNQKRSLHDRIGKTFVVER